MYGYNWGHHRQAEPRKATSSPARRQELGYDRQDNKWIFVRLGVVLAVFLCGAGTILWLAG